MVNGTTNSKYFISTLARLKALKKPTKINAINVFLNRNFELNIKIGVMIDVNSKAFPAPKLKGIVNASPIQKANKPTKPRIM